MPKKPYKEPVFLFTSSSLRLAAWAGWHSAFGDKQNAEKYIHYAYATWAKEVAAGRRFDFAGRFNDDIYFHVDFEKLKSLTDKYLKDINKEIRKTKKSRIPGTNTDQK
jgi:hypothetical protein